jgi:hypothetical protein
MRMTPLWSLVIVTREEAKVIVVVGYFADDRLGPGMGARDGLVEGAQSDRLWVDLCSKLKDMLMALGLFRV